MIEKVSACIRILRFPLSKTNVLPGSPKGMDSSIAHTVHPQYLLALRSKETCNTHVVSTCGHL